MRRWSYSWSLIVLTTGVLACDASRAKGPVVDFAYTDISRAYLDLARAALVARGSAPVDFLYHSAATAQGSETALAFAARMVGRSDVAVVVGPSNSRHALATAPAYTAVRRWLAGLGREHPPFRGITGPIAFGPERPLPFAMVRFVDDRVQRVPASLVAPVLQP